MRRVGGAATCGSGPLRGPPNPSSAERTFCHFLTFSKVLSGGAERRWGARAGTDLAGTASAETGVAGHDTRGLRRDIQKIHDGGRERRRS